MNRIDRLLATILLLQSRRVVKAEDIAAHFEISLRTVYRDVAALSEGGVPIVAEAGVGYGLLQGYTMPPIMFTPDEAAALFLGGEMVEHLTDPSLQTHMRSALLKIRSVLPQPQKDHLDRLKQATALFVAPPQPRGPALAVLTQIQNAIVHRRVLRLEYRAAGRDVSTPRAIEPLGLVYYADRWHLIAFCRLRNDFRDFRTDRIVRLTADDATFRLRPGFSVREYLKSGCDTTRTIEVRVQFTHRAVERVRRSWFAGLLSESPCEEGVVASFPVGSLESLADWVLSFGTEARVLAPAELRRLLAERATRIACHHDDAVSRSVVLASIPTRAVQPLLT